MKRICRILCIIAVIVMMTASLCFADGTEGGLQLLDTYPKEGSSGAAIENFDIKLYFDSKMTKEVLGTANDGCFTLTDADAVDDDDDDEGGDDDGGDDQNEEEQQDGEGE